MRIVLTIHDQVPPRVEVVERAARLGRGEICDVRFSDPSVSEVHAQIRREGSTFSIVDNRSTNGTEVGRIPLRPDERRLLVDDVDLSLGTVRLDVAIEAADPIEGTKSHPEIVVVEGAEMGSSMALVREGYPYRVGRSDDSDLIVSDGAVSSRHVEVRRHGRDIFLRDISSLHGSEMGPSKLEKGKWTPWSPDLHVSLGRVVLAIREPTRAGRQRRGGRESGVPSRAANPISKKSIGRRVEVIFYASIAAAIATCLAVFVWMITR